MNKITFIVYVFVGQRKSDVQCVCLLSLKKQYEKPGIKLENVNISIQPSNL